RNCPDRANAAVPAIPVATCVTMAVPATTGADSSVSAIRPMLGSTPPGPSAVMPMPPTRPSTANATSTGTDDPESTAAPIGSVPTAGSADGRTMCAVPAIARASGPRHGHNGRMDVLSARMLLRPSDLAASQHFYRDVL